LRCGSSLWLIGGLKRANAQTAKKKRGYGALPRQPAGRSLSIRTSYDVDVRAVTAQSLTQRKT